MCFLARNLALLTLLSALFWAQEFRSTLSGIVRDAQGATVPNAKVTATSMEKGTASETNTSASGEYVIPLLEPGTYKLEVTAAGFKHYIQPKLAISTNQRANQDITLEVGAQAESVTVTSEAPLVTTTTASVGQAITSQQVESMPMNGRTPLTLAQLAFGVVPSSDPRFTRPFDNGGPAGFSMGGGQAQSNELLLDGSPDMTRDRRVAYNPPVDAVNEVKVEAFQADAAYGNTGGGTVNITMKGGSNEFHGSLYEFHQNQRLKATPYFTNLAGQRQPVTRFNQFGGTAGGPIFIPKLLNGRNKLFWFFGYEGIRQSEPEPTFSTVPSAAQRRGDLSALLALGPAFQVYDPFTGVQSGTLVRRDPFPGNIIPANRLNPVSQRLLGLIPLPNQPGNNQGANNYFNNAVRSDTFSSYLGRFDWNVSDNHRLFVSSRYNDRVENRGNLFGNIATGNFLSRTNYGATLDDVHTFTPTLLLNTRLNWTRFIEGNTRPSNGFDFTSLGFPAALLNASSRRVLPRIDFGSFTDIGNSAGNVTPFDSFQIFSTLTKIAGRHSVKGGIDFRQQRESSIDYGFSSGSYQFTDVWTRGPFNTSPAAPIGQDLASFLLGAITNSTANSNWDVNAARTQSANYYAFFLQDDWRVTSTLTLNLGLRYERETATIERFNRTVRGFDPGATLALTQAAEAAYRAAPNALLPADRFRARGGVLFADASNRGIYNTDPKAFSPRFGASWAPSRFGGKTVFRGGIGLYYSTFGTFGLQQPGFSQRTPVDADAQSGLRPTATLSNPFPNGVLQPAGASAGPNTFLGQSVRYVNNQLQQPYTVRWAFNIQRQLPANMVVEVGYMGSAARRLGITQEINQIPVEFLSTSPGRDQANIDRIRAQVTNPFRSLLPGLGLNADRISLEQLLRPYPQFTGGNGVITDALPVGYSDFHMFQARVEKRYSAGLNLMANFQWSRMSEATEFLNFQDARPNRAIANEDRPYRLVVSGSYDLPFGKGKAFASGANRLVDLVIGGWQVNGIYTIQPGGPLDWGNVIYFGGDLNWNPRPDVVGPNGARAFDITRFETNAQRQLDLNYRTFSRRFSTYRSDRINNVDLSVIKNFRLFERFTAQLRGEAFNALNRASFNGPDLSPTSANFGRITSTANLSRTIQVALRLRW